VRRWGGGARFTEQTTVGDAVCFAIFKIVAQSNPDGKGLTGGTQIGIPSINLISRYRCEVWVSNLNFIGTGVVSGVVLLQNVSYGIRASEGLW